MAYVTKYRVKFTNEQNEEVEVLIQQKDGTTSAIIEYACSQLSIDTSSEKQEAYDCIWSKTLTIGIWVPEDDTGIDWDTILASNHFDWKVSVTVNGTRKEFEGFIVPEEGQVPFQDKPYEIVLKATTGLALLKGIPLTDINGDPFNDKHSLIEFIAGCLKKTHLDLSIRCYSSYSNYFIQDRENGFEYDMFSQTYLDYRTFLKDAITFVSCYDALLIILDKYCSLEYWNGYWQIVNISDKQYLPGNKYYTDYDSDGTNPVGAQSVELYAMVGRDQVIYPINEDQLRSGKFAVKSAKTQFDYNVWPELPKNNKFERGTQIGSGTNPDTTIYKTFSIDDWQQGYVDLFDLPNPAMVSVTQKFYRKSSYNSFGVEVEREVIGETISTDDANHSFWLRSEAIPINKGDKIKLNLQKKFDSDFSSGSTVFTIPAVLYLVAGGNAYYLDNNVGGHQTNTARWKQAVNLAGQLVIEYPPNTDTREYATLSITSEACPFDGDFYIALAVDGPIANTGANQYYKDITLEYLPFIAGGYIPVKGDYYQRTQITDLPDVIGETVRLSDSPKKVLQGAMLYDNGSGKVLTEPNWFRFSTPAFPNPGIDVFGFKDLLNLGRLNYQWRRMQSIAGTFNGLGYNPRYPPSAPGDPNLNDPDARLPLGGHVKFRLMDLPDERYFIIVPPMKQDFITGWTNVSFLEVSKDGDDGTQLNTPKELKYIF